LSCSSSSLPSSASASYLRRNQEERQAAAQAALLSQGKPSLLTACPQAARTWAVLGAQEDFPCPSTPSQADTAFVQTQPLFKTVLEEGWVAEARHSATPSFFCGVGTLRVQMGVLAP